MRRAQNEQKSESGQSETRSRPGTSAGEDEDAAPVSVTEVSVTVGPITLSPIKYNTMTVGAITARAVVPAGEDAAAVEASVRAWCERKFAEAYKRDLAAYKLMVRNSIEETR